MSQNFPKKIRIKKNQYFRYLISLSVAEHIPIQLTKNKLYLSLIRNKFKKELLMDKERYVLPLYIRLLRTSTKLEQLAKKDVLAYGLNITEFSVMELLYHTGRHTTQAVKEKILIASSSTTYVIDQLVKKGYVLREKNPTDKRVIELCLSASGEELMQEIFPKHAQTITKKFDTLSIDEMEQLQSLLKKLN